MKKINVVILMFWIVNIYSQSSTIIIKTSNGIQTAIRDAIQTSDGGKLILGNYDSLSLIKVDHNNNVLWAKSFIQQNGTRNFEIQEKNSNYYFFYQSKNSGTANLFVSKFNSIGQLLYSKTVLCSALNAIQTENDEKAHMSINSNNEIILNSSLEFMTIHKIDNTGNLIYGLKINADTVNSNWRSFGYCSAICNDGGTVLTGTTDTGAVIVKLDQTGGLLWSKSYKLSTVNNCHPQKIIQSNSSNFLISGYSGDILSGTHLIPFIMKIDNQGNLIWYNEYSIEQLSSQASTDIIEMPNGNIIAHFDSNGKLIETDSYGNVINRKQGVYNCRNIYNYEDTMFLNCFDRTIVAVNSISSINCFGIDLSNTDIIRTVTTNSVVSNCYVKIEAYGILANYPITINDTHFSVTEESCSMVGIEEIKGNNIKIYPNPATSTINILDEQNELQNSTITIKNNLGQSVFSAPFTSQINISTLQPGIYFLNIQDKNREKTVKIIKQ
ncbi:MAG: T9SS type A sorting domain-containing protein [Bacteroidota bacterium]